MPKKDQKKPLKKFEKQKFFSLVFIRFKVDANQQKALPTFAYYFSFCYAIADEVGFKLNPVWLKEPYLKRNFKGLYDDLKHFIELTQHRSISRKYAFRLMELQGAVKTDNGFNVNIKIEPNNSGISKFSENS